MYTYIMIDDNYWFFENNVNDYIMVYGIYNTIDEAISKQHEAWASFGNTNNLVNLITLTNNSADAGDPEKSMFLIKIKT